MTRDALLEAVLQKPGCSIQDLSERLGVSRTAVIHHSRRLQRAGEIRVVRHGRTLLHFSLHVDAPQRSLLGAIRQETARMILEALRSDPSLSGRALARRLQITPKAVRWHIKRLRTQGILEEAIQPVARRALVRPDLIQMLEAQTLPRDPR